MSHKIPAGALVRGNIKLAGHLAGSGGTADAPAVSGHDAIATGDLHPVYTLAAGTRAFSGAQSFGGFKATNVANGTDSGDAANYGQVLALFRALDAKDSVRAATQVALPAYTRVANVITADAVGALPAIDTTVTLLQGERLLLNTGAAAAADKGIYTVTTVGDAGTAFVLTRSLDADSSADVTSGMSVAVEEGTVSGGHAYRLITAGPIDLNTTALTFVDFAAYLSFGSVSAVTGALANGSASTAARSDHQHGSSPATDGDDLGDASHRWDAYTRERFVTVGAKTADYTVTTGDYLLTGDCTTGNLTFLLPAVATNTGRVLKIKRIDGSANSVIIDGADAETIDGAATFTLTTQYEAVELVCTGAAWLIV